MNNNFLHTRSIETDYSLKDNILEGYSIVFDQPSKLIISELVNLPVIETIRSNSITQQTINNSDIFFLFNHKKDRMPLARSKYGKGTLQTSIDSKGVHFRFKIKSSDSDVIEAVENGDLDGCSFGFYAEDDGIKLQRTSDSIKQDVIKIKKLTDFSIVMNPAYEQTTVGVRDLENLKLFTEEQINKEKKLDHYFFNLLQTIENLK